VLPTKQRILCVEDDEDTCTVLTLLLERSNYEVTIASSTDDALRFAQSGSFDLYILDNWFGDGSGIELCQRIRESDPHTPIIFYSAAAYEHDKQEGVEAGAQAYVAKPHIDKLVETVHRLLSSRMRAK